MSVYTAFSSFFVNITVSCLNLFTYIFKSSFNVCFIIKVKVRLHNSLLQFCFHIFTNRKNKTVLKKIRLYTCTVVVQVFWLYISNCTALCLVYMCTVIHSKWHVEKWQSRHALMVCTKCSVLHGLCLITVDQSALRPIH